MQKYPPQLVVLDWDRTLASVEIMTERFYEVGKKYDIDEDKIEKARLKIMADGGTFSPIALTRKVLDQQFEEFKKDFITHKGPEPMYDDGRRLLVRLQEASIPFVVVTYGVSQEWQAMKLAAAGYKGPRLIVDQQEKGKIITKWQFGTDFMFRGEGSDVYASSVALIDDKAKAFTGLPPNAIGFLIDRPHEDTLPNQKGTIPSNVTRIASLDDLIIKDKMLILKQERK